MLYWYSVALHTPLVVLALHGMGCSCKTAGKYADIKKEQQERKRLKGVKLV